MKPASSSETIYIYTILQDVISQRRGNLKHYVRTSYLTIFRIIRFPRFFSKIELWNKAFLVNDV